MIVVRNTLVSDEIAEEYFMCNLAKCEGQCCVTGDRGAPLEESELNRLDEYIAKIKPYLNEAGVKTLELHGSYIASPAGRHFTPETETGACAYAHFDGNRTVTCGIERAYYDGAIGFRKPISCHLYPIRVTRFKTYDALNYHRWSICKSGCQMGKQRGVRLYRFLKDALIRKYGEAWYSELVRQIER